MPTETPPPAPTKEINVSQLGKAGPKSRLPSAMTDAINAAAASRGGNAAVEPPLAEPPQPPTPPVKPAPEPTVAQIPVPPTPPITPTPTQTPNAPPEEPKGIKSVREAYERAEAKAKELSTSLTATTKEKADALMRQAELESKLNSAIEKEEKEYKPRMERLKKVEEDLARKEEILRIKDYTATDEFHNTYVKPLSDVQAEVNELLTELTVDNGDGTARKATMEDFNEILSARSLNDAHTIASAKFGPIASTLVNFRTRVRGLERNRTQAVQNAGIASAEHIKTQQAQMAQNREQFRNTILQEAQRLVGETPELNIADDDTETREVLQRSTQFADDLLEWNPNLTPEQIAKNVAKGRVKIIGHDVIKTKLTKANARIAELETRLKDYESSEPDIKVSNGRAAPMAQSDARSKLAAAAADLAKRRGG